MNRIIHAVALLGAAAVAAGAEPPLLVRVRNFIVNPSTTPVTHVLVKNAGASDYAGTLKVTFPQGWKTRPAECPLELRPGELKRLPFTIEGGADRAANVYPVRIVAESAAGRLEVEQAAVTASAPYFKPKIDGDLEEWKDSIPITFTAGGRKTVVRAYWSSKQFSLAVEIEEDELKGHDKVSADGGMDAVQFALAPAPDDAAAKTGRYEFLMAAAADGGRAWQLLKPGDDEALMARKRPLAGMEASDIKVAVKRDGRLTVYEAGVPFKLLPDIQPAPGRELRFSLLVHDPGGAGVRDLGSVMNRWEEDRRPLGWCSWEHVKWGDTPPFDSNVEFGLCSSIH
jgi:hypothetical protein